MKEKGSMARTGARQTDSLTSRLLLRFLVGRCSFRSIRAGVIQAGISALPKAVYFWCVCVLKQLPRDVCADGPQHMVPLSARALACGSPGVLSGVIRGRSVTAGPYCPPQVCSNINLVFLHYKTPSSAGKDDTH